MAGDVPQGVLTPSGAAEVEIERLRAESDRLRKDRDSLAKELEDLAKKEETHASNQLKLLAAQLSKEIKEDFLDSVKQWLWVLALLVSVATAGGLFTLSDILENRIDSAVEGRHKDIERLREGILDAIVEAKLQVADVKSQAAAASNEVAVLKAEMSEHKRKVATESEGAIVEIRKSVLAAAELNPEQQDALQKAKEQQPERFPSDPARRWKFWANGSTIRIRFLDGDSATHEKVKQIAQEWTKYANLAFDFVDFTDADVRVSFDKGGGSWSFLGTDALAIKGQATMNLGWIDRPNILHEFGRVLGLIHEFNNPKANIPWNKDLIYREQAGQLWPTKTIDENVFAQVSASELGDYRDFDPRSVMNFTFPAAWTGGLALEQGEELSESDKALAARLYPRTNRIIHSLSGP